MSVRFGSVPTAVSPTASSIPVSGSFKKGRAARVPLIAKKERSNVQGRMLAVQNERITCDEQTSLALRRCGKSYALYMCTFRYIAPYSLPAETPDAASASREDQCAVLTTDVFCQVGRPLVTSSESMTNLDPARAEKVYQLECRRFMFTISKVCKRVWNRFWPAS